MAGRSAQQRLDLTHRGISGPRVGLLRLFLALEGRNDMSVDTDIVTEGITLTEVAANKVKALLSTEEVDDLALRISVAPGGCAGLRYQLALDERRLDGDVVSEFYGVSVVTDRMSAPYLVGATIDFVDTIEQQGFTIDNPNSTGSCACGDSFN